MLEGEAWRLPGRVVLEHLRDELDLLQDLLAVVARRLEKAHDRLCSFAHDSVPARISRLLLAEPDSEKIVATRRALGEEAGTTVETTIRVLRSFERSGWVEGGVGWVRVIDRGALARIAEGQKPDAKICVPCVVPINMAKETIIDVRITFFCKPIIIFI